MSKKKRSNKREFKPFISKVYLPSAPNEYSQGENIFLMDAYCKHDDIQFIYRVEKQSGFNEYESIKCPCCNSLMYSGGRRIYGFSSYTEPEVVAWVEKQKGRGLTLRLVFTKSISEIEMTGLQNLLQKQRNIESKRVKVFQLGTFFRPTLTPLKRGLISKLELLNTIEYTKRDLEPEERLTPRKEKSKAKNIPQNRLRKLQRSKYSKSAQESLKNYKSVIQDQSGVLKGFVPIEKYMELQSMKKSGLKGSRSLKKIRLSISEKEALARSISEASLKLSHLRVVESELLEPSQDARIIGQISKTRKKLREMRV